MCRKMKPKFSRQKLREITGFNVTGPETGHAFSTVVRGLSVNLEGYDYAIPVGNRTELIEPLQQLVEAAGFEVQKTNLKGFRIEGKPEAEHLESYSTLLKLINGCELEGLGYGRERHPLFRDEYRTAYPLTLASSKQIRVLLNNGMGHLIRLNARALLYADEQDNIITVGSSSCPQYREHVVPCILVAQRAAELCMEGKSDEEVASFIKDHLAIVRISIEQARYLDIDLKLKDRMPEGWGDSIYARLEFAEIEFDFY